MPTNKVSKSLSQALTHLQHERDRIDGAIGELEGALGQSAADAQLDKRGRRGSVTAQTKATRTVIFTKPRSREGWTQAARAAAGARMRRYWADLAAGKNTRPRAKKTKQGADKAPKAQPHRSTSGWTDTARSKAGARMRSYWAARRQEEFVTG